MKRAITALGIFFGSFLYAVIWIRIFYFAFNYREIDNFGEFLLFSFMLIVFLVLGFYINFIVFVSLEIYINATILRSPFREQIHIAYPLLLYGSIITFVLSICIGAVFGIDVFGIDFWSLGIILLFPIIGLVTASHLQTNKSVKHFLIKIYSGLLINLIVLMVVCINNFPGVNASIEARERWAYRELRNYSTIVNSLKSESFGKIITDKVGEIRFVAPTKGRNLFYPIGGSSGPYSELTLEVVGQKGKGIAYICTWGGHGITSISFEYQGKKTKRWGLESCN